MKQIWSPLCLAVTIAFSSCAKHGTSPNPDACAFAEQPGSSTLTAPPKTGPLMVTYCNSANIADVGYHTLARTGANTFDIGIYFASNINYDVAHSRPLLVFNQQDSLNIIGHPEWIASVHSHGIKLLMSVLGNHQGAGLSNLTSQAMVNDFADQIIAAENKYKFDGVDFDDEYADYGDNNTPQPNDSSFILLLEALRKRQPQQLITVYNYGPAGAALATSLNGVSAGSLIDYAWYPYYGGYSLFNIPGLAASRSGSASYDFQEFAGFTGFGAILASQVQQGGGAYMTFTLDGDRSAQMTEATQVLFNQATVYNASDTGNRWQGVVFYQDDNYAGNATSRLVKGKYSMSALSAYGITDSTASSVYVPKGWTVTIFAGDNFQGQSLTICSSVAAIQQKSGPVIGSMIIH
jgi:Glycosyl hydrolases family 18